MHRPVPFPASSEKQTGSSDHEFQGALVSIYKNSENPPTNPLHSIDLFLIKVTFENETQFHKSK